MRRNQATLVLTAFSLLLGACEGSMVATPPLRDSGTSPGRDASTPANEPTVTLRTTADGAYLADGDGNTLYVFARDVPTSEGADGVSSCAGMCATNWPAFDAGELVAGEGVNAAAFGEITRADGSKQTTYRGWPLYRFANDASPGAVNGDGTGGVWFVARAPFYTVTLRADDDSGRFLVDGDGNTLYLFRNDTRGNSTDAPVSACNGMCLNNWPVVPAADVRIPSGLDAALFSTFERADGTEQLAYNGWPLYYFASDDGPGDKKGDGVGGVWELIAAPAN